VGGPHPTLKSDAHINPPPLNPSQCAATGSPAPEEPAEPASAVPGALGEELGQGKWVAAWANSSSEDLRTSVSAQVRILVFMGVTCHAAYCMVAGWVFESAKEQTRGYWFDWA
jgi:hypothetical protein